MADPAPYVVNYSFAGFQANSPTTPLPGAALDNELVGAATAIATLVAAIESIRRSDGALQNGVVTFDSFEQGLQLLLDPTNGQLVAAAVAIAQAAQTSSSASAATATAQALIATAQAVAAAASAGSVNLSLYLAKANNLAGLGSLSTSRANLGLGSAAVLNAGVLALNAVQLDGNAKLPAIDGSQLTGIDILPVGTTIWVNSVNPPAGFLKENGQLISRTVYQRLWIYAAAGGAGNLVSEATWSAGYNGAFSTGDLSTTFRLPDSRGWFTRSYDDGAGVDSGRVLGANQADTLKDHTHTVGAAITGTNQAVNAAGSVLNSQPATLTTSGARTGAATETRPRNISKLACIKF